MNRLSLAALLALPGLAAPSSVHADDSLPPCQPIRVGHEAGGPQAIAVQGSLAAVANSYGGLLLLDVSDPAAMIELSNLDLKGNAIDIALIGDTAYVVLAGGALQIVDVADPTRPRHLSSSSWGNDVYAVEVVGDRAYLAELGGVRILDVSDARTPVSIGQGIGPGFYASLAIAWPAAYVLTSCSFAIYDISDEENPIWIDSWDTGDCDAGNILITNGDLAFAEINDSSGVRILDISDPLDPQFVPAPGLGSARAAWSEGSLLVLGSYQELRVLDISNAQDPVELGTMSPGGLLGSMASLGSTLLVPELDYGVISIDLDDPANPIINDHVMTLGMPWSFADRAEQLFAFGQTSMSLLDTTVPADPTQRDNVRLFGTSAVFRGDFAIIPGSDKLQVVDISDPDALELVLEYEHDLYSLDIDANEEGIACIAAFQDGMAVLDISNPEDIRFLSFFNPGRCNALTMRDNLVFIAGGTDGLLVVDISDPERPELIGQLDGMGLAARILLRDELVYIAESYSGIAIVDVSDPASPVHVTRMALGPWVGDMCLEQGTLFVPVTEYFSVDPRVHVIDVRDPTLPLELDRIEVTRAPTDVHVVGSSLYVATHYGGIEIFDVASCLAPPCAPDFDRDGAIDIGDLLQLLGMWWTWGDNPEDLNRNGIVGPLDLEILLSTWGPCPG